jgi:hypothetical protein
MPGRWPTSDFDGFSNDVLRSASDRLQHRTAIAYRLMEWPSSLRARDRWPARPRLTRRRQAAVVHLGRWYRLFFLEPASVSISTRFRCETCDVASSLSHRVIYRSDELGRQQDRSACAMQPPNAGAGKKFRLPRSGCICFQCSNRTLSLGNLNRPATSAPAANASDLSIQLDVGGIAWDGTRIGLGRRAMIRRRAFGMMMRGLPREGRRRCHKHHDHDRDQRSHFNPHFTRRFSTACLPP